METLEGDSIELWPHVERHEPRIRDVHNEGGGLEDGKCIAGERLLKEAIFPE